MGVDPEPMSPSPAPRPRPSRRRGPVRLAAAGLITAALVLGACGDDDDTAADTTEATSATGAADGTTGGSYTEEDFVQAGVDDLQIGDEDIERCLTQATIDAIGFDNIVATGLAPEELFRSNGLDESGLSVPEERHDQLKSDIAGCGDLVELYATEGAESETEAACAREHLTNELISEIFVLSIAETEPSAELEAASDEMEACLDAG